MSGSAIPAGLFCAHKKLKTTCPDCRPPPEENPVVQARAEKQRKDAERKAAAKARKRASTRDAPSDADDDAEPARPKRTVRRRVKPPTREEAEQAEAWWVK